MYKIQCVGAEFVAEEYVPECDDVGVLHARPGGNHGERLLAREAEAVHAAQGIGQAVEGAHGLVERCREPEHRRAVALVRVVQREQRMVVVHRRRQVRPARVVDGELLERGCSLCLEIFADVERHEEGVHVAHARLRHAGLVQHSCVGVEVLRRARHIVLLIEERRAALLHRHLLLQERFVCLVAVLVGTCLLYRGRVVLGATLELRLELLAVAGLVAHVSGLRRHEGPAVVLPLPPVHLRH
mmetsp:Transcript_4689/g.16494  ORF Transcript_4689/g.16494 Transcript_4689/m.16494 type:complete len:242 (+) Transcript_4689:963-1688(+)